jgi:predicted RNA binding protein YcfA (HicA-like mRNA interferase family)
MPKLPRIKPKQLIRALKRLGFVLDRIQGSHPTLYRDDQSSPVTVPMHNRDMKTGTLHAILRDAKIRVEDLIKVL